MAYLAIVTTFIHINIGLPRYSDPHRACNCRFTLCPNSSTGLNGDVSHLETSVFGGLTNVPPHCDSQADTTVHTLNSSLNTTKTIRSLTQSYKSAQNELDVSRQISYTVYIENTFFVKKLNRPYLLREFLDPLTILPGCLMIHSRSHALNN